MRAHQHVHRAIGKTLERSSLLSRRHKARQNRDLKVKRRKAREEGLEVLLGQNRGGAQNHDLLGVLATLEGRAQGHLGLAKAHVAAKQAVHRLFGLHVCLDVGDGVGLVRRELVTKVALHLLLHRRIRREGHARHCGAARIEVYQVKRQLLSRAAGLAGGSAPVGGVKAGKARASAVGAHVARNAVDLLKRHKQPIFARVLKQEVVALFAVDLLAHDVREKRDAVRGVDHVVARLKREGDGRRVHAPAAARLGRARVEVRDRKDAQVGLGHHDAGGHGSVGEGHTVAGQGGGHGAGGRVVGGAGILGGRPQRLAKGDVLVIKPQLKGIASRAIGDSKDHRRAVLQKLPHAPQQLGIRTRDAGLAHLKLGRHTGRARAQDRREAQALLLAKIHLARIGVKAFGLDARRVGGHVYLVHRAHAVVKQGARLGQDHQRIGTDVVDGAGRASIEHWQVALERGLRRTGLDKLQICRNMAVFLGFIEQRPTSAGHHVIGQGHLSARRNAYFLKLADGLLGRGNHAAQAVDLVAKELQAHRACGLRGKDVDGVAVHVEGAGGRRLAVVDVAHAHQQGRDLVKRDLVANRKGARRKIARAHRRHAPQQRGGRGHADALLASRQASHGLATSTNNRVIGRGLCPGAVLAQRVAAHQVLAKPRGQGAGRAIGGLFSRDNQQARARVRRPKTRQHQRTRRLCDGQCDVVARLVLGKGGRQALGLEQLVCNAVDQHGGGLSHQKRPGLHATPA